MANITDRLKKIIVDQLGVDERAAVLADFHRQSVRVAQRRRDRGGRPRCRIVERKLVLRGQRLIDLNRRNGRDSDARNVPGVILREIIVLRLGVEGL